MGKRDTQILELLSANGRMEVSELASLIGVSQVTLRKDLDGLASQGLARREHGFALPANPNDLAGRLAFHYKEKVRLASRAAELVGENETVMVENGSSCALLARTLFESHRDVTVVTNSAFICNYVRDLPRARTVLLGGAYQNDAQVVTGPILRTTASAFHVRLLFVGCDGWSPKDGFTNANLERAQAVADMAERAERVVVLTESAKFEQQGVAGLDLNPKTTTVVTDDGIGPTARDALVAAGTELIIA